MEYVESGYVNGEYIVISDRRSVVNVLSMYRGDMVSFIDRNAEYIAVTLISGIVLYFSISIIKYSVLLAIVSRVIGFYGLFDGISGIIRGRK